MKLRITGSSIRMRLLRSEVAKLIEQGRVEETIYLGPNDSSSLTYALMIEDTASEVHLRHAPSKIEIVLPRGPAETWASTEQVGIYASDDVGVHGSIDLIAEKDFACLDLSDADNQDTFSNPQIGAAC
jgi:hypothetical protein